MIRVGKLVPFDPLKVRSKRRAIAKPPGDPLKRASWLHDLLCGELEEIVQDEKLGDTDRRELVLQFAGKITGAMPHHEISAARDEVRGDEADGKNQSLGGTVTRAAKRTAGPLRAQAPRRQRG